MAMAVVVLAILCGILLVGHIRRVQELRFLCRQLQELERGSHIELGTRGRQRDMLALCRELNHLRAYWCQGQIRYERAENRLKQNIAGLAHDIRTPLTGAAGYLQLARECSENERRDYYLGVAQERLGDLQDMLEELFLYTKLTSEGYAPDMRDIQVLPLLSECLVGLYRSFEEKGVSPEVEFQQEEIRVWADEECLRRIFLNLIQNGLIHGTGEIRIRQEGGYLTFENEVPPGNEPDPEHIFDRFYKADPARQKGSSGLGLFIVKELAESMGGQVSARLEEGRLRILLQLQTKNKELINSP